VDSFITDVRYGVRMLWKTPGLTIVATLTIALGVGLTTHTFSVVYGSILRGLDFDRGTPLISLSQDIPSQGSRGGSVPILDLLDWRERQTSFRGLAGFLQGNTINLADEGAPPERYVGARVSANLFEQVDGVPIMGRVFNAQEDAGQGEQVVILGYDVWQNRYAGAPDIIGLGIRVNSVRATVVGVMPEGFHFPFEENVWLPLGIDPVAAVRGADNVQVVGRLLEGVSLEQADTQMRGIANRIAEAYPETNEGVGVWVQTYEDQVMPPEIVAVLWIMLIAVFGVLLIACFNVANLLLARAAVRSREIAVRSALGADRNRLIRQLMMEAAMLAIVGGLAGVAMAWIGVEVFNASTLDIQKPYWIDIRLDGPALLFTLAITAFACVAAGTVPAIHASGAKIHEILQDESRGSSSFRMGRISSVLVIGEIALSCALLVAAGMMVKSVINVNQLDMGFEGDQVFTARVGLFEADYPDDQSRLRFFDRLLEELRSEPDVVAAGLTQTLPALGSGTVRIALEGVAYPELRDQPLSNFTTITPGYLETLSVGLSEGRDFTEADREGAVATAIVNESFRFEALRRGISHRAAVPHGSGRPLANRRRPRARHLCRRSGFRGERPPRRPVLHPARSGHSRQVCQPGGKDAQRTRQLRQLGPSRSAENRSEPAAILGADDGPVRGNHDVDIHALRIALHDLRGHGPLPRRGRALRRNGVFRQPPQTGDGYPDGNGCRNPQRVRAGTRKGDETARYRGRNRTRHGRRNGPAPGRGLLRGRALRPVRVRGDHRHLGPRGPSGVSSARATGHESRAGGGAPARLRCA